MFYSQRTFWDPCEPVLKKSQNVLSEESIECDKVSNEGSGEESCCEEPVPLESDGVSMEVNSKSGEEKNSTPEYHEEYTAEEIEANYGRQLSVDRKLYVTIYA